MLQDGHPYKVEAKKMLTALVDNSDKLFELCWTKSNKEETLLKLSRSGSDDVKTLEIRRVASQAHENPGENINELKQRKEELEKVFKHLAKT